MIQFFVRGIPKGQARPRAFTRMTAKGPVARVYDSGSAEAWKGDIILQGAPHRPKTCLEGPLSVELTFYLPRPKSLRRKKDPELPIRHTKKPDRDNLEKAVLDALTKDGWWRDDSQVCAGEVKKYYEPKEGPTGARITIKSIADP